MSKSSKASKLPKARRAGTPEGPSWARNAAHIAALSEKAIDPQLSDDQLDSVEEELDGLIEKHIRACEDGILNEALRTIFARNEDAAEYLTEQLEGAATSVGVLTVEPDGESGHGVLRLFAIPVVSSKIGGLGQDFELHTGQGLLDEFAKSFKRFGLVSASDTVAVPAYLYHPQELDALTWSETRAIMTDTMLGLAGKSPKRVAPGRTGWPRPPTRAAGTTVVELRYLLVIVMACEQSFRPFTPFQLTQEEIDTLQDTKDFAALDEDDEEEDARWAAEASHYSALVTDWEAHITPIVMQMLGLATTNSELLGGLVSVDAPDDFFEAYRHGLSAYAIIGMEVTVQSGLKAEGLLSVETHAIAAVYFDETSGNWEARVSVLREDGSLLLGAVRRIWPFEDIDDVLLDVADSLEDARFAGVTVLPRAISVTGQDPTAFMTHSGLALPGTRHAAGASLNKFASDPSFKGH